MEKRVRSIGITSHMEKSLRRIPFGELFCVSDLQECGSSNAIHQALARAVKDGKLERFARGLYYKSEKNAQYKFDRTDIFLCKSRQRRQRKG
jgi:hypothetical protein